ncbi:hypothetical protein ACROYT_G028027 [Oculina patagonica]
MILPADKGRASVVLDTDNFRSKMSILIGNGPYQLLNKDPTDRLTRKLTEKLLTLKRSGDLSEAVYNKIRPRHKPPPRIYGLPKIHKTDIPLRPIVSCVNTFAYDLSAYLANILSPLTGKSDFAVTNSAHFVSTISSETILDNEIMVSFDVESLFTNVPIDGAVQAALRKLENDPSLADRTTLTPAQIADLLNFVLRSTYFQYNGSIYELTTGRRSHRKRSPRPESRAPVLSLRPSLNLLRFYPMSKVFPNNLDAAYNNKAYALFSSRELH